MDLASQIYVRKSCRKYLDDEIDMKPIKEFLSNVKPLNPEIKYYYEILTKDEVNLKTRWKAPYYLAIYSEKKDNSGVNAGFVFQQLSLYMQTLGIGSCWVGMGSIKDNNPEFIILMAFGKSDDLTRDISKFKRKDLSEIADSPDDKLKPAQLAPSAVNSQPWYFKHTDEGYDVFKVKPNVLKRKIIGKWMDVDVGIALAHLYVSNPDTFEFEVKNKNDIKGYSYIGSLII
ncbi:MAG: hypothetical protein IJQ68_04805 [Methanobrevibacter sp.]|uniref:nitroreductase family protein n=1 Tax=Methanobrevibacter sp. TaxID=66852 RepID=UPI0025DC6BCC|nr:nitroreductase family protein [Methanobrevibacter sp.]MBR0271298.1 hypothetical protein [Methanobrevibacter sp.]